MFEICQPAGGLVFGILIMETQNYNLICGIEIHVELRTASKMFCGCVNDPFGAQKPNIYTCPVCLGMPGALPVANKKAIEWTIRIGHALGCEINLFSKFDRKHYFYPDLPKGYQISQYDQPLCVNGLVKTEFGDVRITRIHLEEDTGKLVHQEVNGEKVSLVDFNRSSVPLVEIVTEPDIHSPQQAKAYAKKIHQIIRALHVSDADMEKGSMRLEANISMQGIGDREQGILPQYKVEVKNLNSFRFVEKAIQYEMKRQAELLEKNETPKQETRGWNEAKQHTFPQRSKESAEDYRYFPDPDLPPMRFTREYVEQLKKDLPELPEATIERWQKEFGIKENDAKILADDIEHKTVLDVLWSTAKDRHVDTAKLASLLVNKKIIVDFGISTYIEEALTAMEVLSSTMTIANDVLIAAINEVIAANPKAVVDYKARKTAVIGFFIGAVSKKLGKVDSNQVRNAVQEMLR
ncbi:Asp-tRNA(Asn)/Glu-tRNA(Gln) amidotransferase GatCAB subunit B [Candidatus Cerribacteria bacterium 'Amazon FNV 2010 28 9']|uniref:Aspartyl/glutamyl-tRNA(Asn/Gln) amidotransferase subunit B n=1 Tax=Candidatus Cerribacteria bacterium 'Amazon FNV 2010 28 9' TaxID=2081795 RepID=A0A317JPH1_9BACT|nr:MAG: Asp-tRNA(Asn)/Glu-tRNA(Gln) amidotransferase GatCAB subunit B [Candidatus Cerribacteria bacterium 'Amazon FNV 2010 28 9']